MSLPPESFHHRSPGYDMPMESNTTSLPFPDNRKVQAGSPHPELQFPGNHYYGPNLPVQSLDNYQDKQPNQWSYNHGQSRSDMPRDVQSQIQSGTVNGQMYISGVNQSNPGSSGPPDNPYPNPGQTNSMAMLQQQYSNDNKFMPEYPQEQKLSMDEKKMSQGQEFSPGRVPLGQSRVGVAHMGQEQMPPRVPVPVPYMSGPVVLGQMQAGVQYPQYPYPNDPAQPGVYPAQTSVAYPTPSYDTNTGNVPQSPSQVPGYPTPVSGYSAPSAYSKHSDKVKRVRIEMIDRVLCRATELEPQVFGFTGRRGDKEYLSLEEQLTRCILDLDKVQTDGIEDIRNARKSAIRIVQYLIDALDEKCLNSNY
ncbi:hypothetical protein QZH41_002559 [Actinostola sp. cb2023]|nr:hypothetical protein QZH41_002559 [Actinostola sp. cb2023]